MSRARSRTRLASLVVLGGLVAGGAVPVQAAQPIMQSRHVDATFTAPNTTAACGFLVREHIEGETSVTAFYDTAGRVVREIDNNQNMRVTWFAPARGTSFSFPFNAPTTYDYPGGAVLDGPAIVTFEGFNAKAPGSAANAGRTSYAGVVIGFDGDGVPFVDFGGAPLAASGNLGTFTLADRCAALAG